MEVDESTKLAKYTPCVNMDGDFRQEFVIPRLERRYLRPGWLGMRWEGTKTGGVKSGTITDPVSTDFYAPPARRVQGRGTSMHPNGAPASSLACSTHCVGQYGHTG